MKKPVGEILNLRREKAIKHLVENGGSIGNAMRKAGYSPKTAKTPKKLTNTKAFKEAVLPILEALELERQAIMQRLPEVREKAGYRDLMDGLDKTTKNIQLLSGKDTSKEAVTFTWQS